MADDDIVGVNSPTGVPLAYTFRQAADGSLVVLDKHYEGDPATIAAKIEAVANQGKARG